MELFLSEIAVVERGAVARSSLAGEAEALFCDPDFPANASSLFRDPHVPWRGHPPPVRVRWLRPAEICAQVCDGPPPALFVDGAASTDVVQAEAMR